MKYRWFGAVACMILLLCGSGCGRKYVQLSDLPVLNYTAPVEGEEIAVIHVKDYGDIKLKLFPELLPEACENFLTLAKDGYYDELIFHRVIENFMIQGGDPKGDGTGGESCWGGYFDGGSDSQLINLSGALAYANSGSTSTDGSQFYIVTGQSVTTQTLDELSEAYQIYYTPESRELYQQYGGAPWLDGGNYTVFGQVIDGMDIVEAISHVPTNPETDKPKESVYIESITVEQYDGSEIHWHPVEHTQE